MSHLTRVLLLFSLLLLCTLSSPAQNTNGVVAHRSATQLRDFCKEYIAVADAKRTSVVGANECIGYIEGAVDAFALTTPGLPESFQACVPKGATGDELIRVFLKFIDGHPEKLSYSAAEIVWEAMMASYPCHAK